MLLVLRQQIRVLIITIVLDHSRRDRQQNQDIEIWHFFLNLDNNNNNNIINLLLQVAEKRQQLLYHHHRPKRQQQPNRDDVIRYHRIGKTAAKMYNHHIIETVEEMHKRLLVMIIIIIITTPVHQHQHQKELLAVAVVDCLNIHWSGTEVAVVLLQNHYPPPRTPTAIVVAPHTKTRATVTVTTIVVLLVIVENVTDIVEGKVTVPVPLSQRILMMIVLIIPMITIMM
jgi:hypothetical protein